MKCKLWRLVYPSFYLTWLLLLFYVVFSYKGIVKLQQTNDFLGYHRPNIPW